jgi:restriction system protein
MWTHRDYRRDPFPFIDPVVDSEAIREAMFDEAHLKAKRPDTFLRTCPYCAVALTDAWVQSKPEDWFGQELDQGDPDWSRRSESRVAFCGTCGWHSAAKVVRDRGLSEWNYELYAASASLCELSTDHASQPLEELRTYLRLKYESRFTLSPKALEEIVASVYKDLGYAAVVAGHSTDGGIDIVLSKGDQTIGVQVKRYRDSIEAEAIRSLTGALVLRGLTRGVFVTTSQYRSGAVAAAESYKYRGYSVELIDGDRFFEMLDITKSPKADCLPESAQLQLLDKLERLIKLHYFSGHGAPCSSMTLESYFSDLYDGGDRRDGDVIAWNHV